MSKKKTVECRYCHCTQRKACIGITTAHGNHYAGPCHWVEHDVCSNPDCVARCLLASEMDRLTCSPNAEHSIINAILLKRAASQHLAALMAKTYPIGSTVFWWVNKAKGRYEQSGEVTHHGNTGYLRARNERTGKTVWIGFYDIHGFVG